MQSHRVHVFQLKEIVNLKSKGKRNITQDGTDIHTIYETPVNSESVRSNVANHSFHTSSSTSNVKDKQENDKIGSKPDKNEKRGEAGKSQKQLQ
nr:hypothetical protein [Tanacetum cinerariifolium]